MPPHSEIPAGGPYSVVQKPIPHDSAVLHVTGAATYIDDIREPRGTLHIVPGYSANAVRGRITKLDLSAVSDAPGVVAVLTARDIPGLNECSPSIGGDPVFADRAIEFHGQVVFAVIGETMSHARRAARLGAIEVEAEVPVITVDEAALSGETVLPDYRFLRGDPNTVLEQCDKRLSGQITIGGQEHFYLETQVALAHPGEDGAMTVISSTQHPSEIQHIVAQVLNLPSAAVTAQVRRMGGGFGGKESQANQWAAIAAVGAAVTGRPCKVRLDRDDDMIMTGKRHDCRAAYTVGFSNDGTIEALDIKFSMRCGYSADLSLGVCDRTMFHADNAYYLDNVSIRSQRLKTNTCSNTAFRGFGGPQGILAAECYIDAIATKLGMDPLEIRKKNFYGLHDRNITPYGMTVEDNILREIVTALEKTSEYWKRRAALKTFNLKSGVLKRGLALTPVKFGISFTLPHLNQAGALVHVYADGSVHLNHGGTEMGQGLFIKVAQVVAEEFGITIEQVKISATSTGKVPNTAPTAASSGSDLNGMAAKNAAATIKARMADFAAGYFQVPGEAIDFRDGQVILGNGSIEFGELAKLAFQARVQLSSTGYFATPKITWVRDQVSGRPFYYFAYGAACSEVTVDTMTGEMRVDRVDILHDVGKSLNPAIDMGQIEGGFVQGLGWLTNEELVWNAQGKLMTHAPSTYKIPTASDIPDDFRVHIYDSPGNREETIYSSKAVGEPPLMLATSVYCAIADAVASLYPGRVPELNAPATPEAIMHAVKSMKRAT